MDCKTKPKKFVMSCSGTSQYSWEKCNAGLHPECFKGYHVDKKKKIFTSDIVALWTYGFLRL